MNYIAQGYIDESFFIMAVANVFQLRRIETFQLYFTGLQLNIFILHINSQQDCNQAE